MSSFLGDISDILFSGERHPADEIAAAAHPDISSEHQFSEHLGEAEPGEDSPESGSGTPTPRAGTPRAGTPMPRPSAAGSSGPYRYEATPSILCLQPAQASDAVRQFEASVGAFVTDADGHAMVDPANEDGKVETPLQAWSLRNAKTSDVGRYIGKDAQRVQQSEMLSQFRAPGNSSSPSDHFFAYQLGDTPVALMSVRQHPDKTKVTNLTTHPGVKGAGETMIEKAVNDSDGVNHQGVLHLESLKGSEGFYDKLGFQRTPEAADDNIQMKLNPSASEHWSKKDGTWSLNKSEGKKYLRSDET